MAREGEGRFTLSNAAPFVFQLMYLIRFHDVILYLQTLQTTQNRKCVSRRPTRVRLPPRGGSGALKGASPSPPCPDPTLSTRGREGMGPF